MCQNASINSNDVSATNLLIIRAENSYQDSIGVNTSASKPVISLANKENLSKLNLLEFRYLSKSKTFLCLSQPAPWVVSIKFRKFHL
jgi:hypothetical protein